MARRRRVQSGLLTPWWSFHGADLLVELPGNGDHIIFRAGWGTACAWIVILPVAALLLCGTMYGLVVERPSGLEWVGWAATTAICLLILWLAFSSVWIRREFVVDLPSGTIHATLRGPWFKREVTLKMAPDHRLAINEDGRRKSLTYRGSGEVSIPLGVSRVRAEVETLARRLSKLTGARIEGAAGAW